jgi:hypothetical protein
MSIFNDKALKGVAEAAAKIMAETSHGSHPKTPKEKSLAALAHPKDKITHKDVLVGRGVLKKEDIEQLDEVGDTKAGRKALHKYVDKAISTAMYKPNEIEKRKKGLRKATSRLYKDDYYGKKNEEVELNEEAEQLQEYESKDGKYTHKGTYGREKGAQYGESDYSKGGEEEKETEKAMKSPKRAQKGYGARQNTGMRGQSTGEKKKKVNESLSFTEMLELYNEHGLKVLAPIETEEMDIDGTTVEVIDADKVNGVVATIVEEPTNDEFTKEYEDQKASFEGKKKQPKVAAGKTTGVKVMPEEVELDEEYEYISEAEYLELDEDEQQLWEAVTSQSYSNLRDKKSKVPATEFGAKGTKTKVLDQIRHHEFRKTHSTGKNVYATDYKVGKKDTAEMMYRKKSGKKGQVPSQRAGLRRDRYNEEVELDERTLTAAETAKKEQIVKSMKKGLAGFKARYGERAKEVMYATATSMAKKKS